MASFGCYYHPANFSFPHFLPQVNLNAHATILSSTSRTILTQTFINPSSNGPIKELSYTFPLYDGVSVVGFTCHVEDRVLQGEVKPKEKADAEYHEAVDLGQTAGILDHSSSAQDVFVLRLGNVAADGKVVVEITLIEELKQDAQSDGVRYTLPNVIAPRYGSATPDTQISSSALPAERHGVSITVDVAVGKGSVIRGIDSPSHPIQMLLGRTSTSPESTFEPHQASASLHLASENAFLDRDFVVKVNADGQDKPLAFLETHPTISNQRALMTTLVPKFNLPSNNPEIVFIIDRSGSMTDKIPTLRSALKVFLKSLPLGVHFNICSFGSRHEFLWPQSVPYDERSLKKANKLADSIQANFGGTELHGAVESTVNNRLGDKDLEVLILTDGQIWNQDKLFSFVADASSENKIRFFTLGVGDAASHSLIEGIARSGNGFSQSVLNYEELDRKVVRMLKGALMPHIHDYNLDVEYDAPLETDSEFELVDSVDEPAPTQASTTLDSTEKTASPQSEPVPQEPISLFDSEYKEPSISIEPVPETDLPSIPLPDLLQAPSRIPNLYPFIRLSAYILLGPQMSDRIPQSLVFRATSKHGPLVLKIPIQDVGKGEMIHQLACRKAVREIEEGHGWLEEQITNIGQSKKNGLIARECERLGTQFQVTGKYCSFVAVEKNPSAKSQKPETQEPGQCAVEHVPAAHDQRHSDLSSGGLRQLGRVHSNLNPPSASAQMFCSAQSTARTGSLFGSAAPQPAHSFASFGTPLFGARCSTRGGFGEGPRRGRGGRGGGPSGSLFGSAAPHSSASFGSAGIQPTALFGGSASADDNTPCASLGSSSSLFGGAAPQPSASFGSTGFQHSSPFGSNNTPFASASKRAREASFCDDRDEPCASINNLFAGDARFSSSSVDKMEVSADTMQVDSLDEESATAPNKVHAIIALQSLHGFWKWSMSLLKIIELDETHAKEKIMKELQGVTPENGSSFTGDPFGNDDNATTLATMLAIAFLENKCAESKDTWELVKDKAENWIQTQEQTGTNGNIFNKYRAAINTLF